MKKLLSPKNLPWFTMGAAGLSLALQRWYFSGLDEKGLLPAGHPAAVLTLVLLALTLAVVFLSCRRLAPVGKYTRLFPAGPGRAIGCAAAAFGALWGGLSVMHGNGGIGIVTLAAGIAAAVAMLFLAALRWKGGRPKVALHTLFTLFMMLFTVCSCKGWGSEPQVLTYLFPLLSCIFLMLTGYQNAVLAVQKSSRSKLVFYNQAALFCCCVSLAGENRLFYLAMLLHLALDLCNVDRVMPEEA